MQIAQTSIQARNLRQAIEVSIARQEIKIVLHGQGGNPYVVGGNRRSLYAQLMKDMSIMVSCVLVGIKHPDAAAIQEPRQHALVAPGLCSAQESGAQLGQTDKREANFLGALEPIHGLPIGRAEIAIPVGINQDFHFHNSGSILSMSLRALSNLGSSTQVPARSSKS